MNAKQNGTLVAKMQNDLMYFGVMCINKERHYNEASGSLQFLKNGILLDAPQIFIFQHNWDFSSAQAQSYSRSQMNATKILFEIPVK